uniref:Peptidase S1 domain-containing protein n=1 Tax=Rhabditophanes sp. KR3021 TaxID=114890 RepID=A0AC35UC09_9BILA
MNQLKTFKQIEDIIVSFGDDCNRKIKTVVLDSEFMIKGCRNGHDFAIIELETPIEFNANVRPICLPYLNHYIPETMTIVSFGLKNFFSKSSPLMREFKMKHDPMCEKPDSDKMPTDMPDFICAKAFDPTDYSSPRVCHGDSGASLIQRSPDGRNTLVGEVSFGTPGCPANELVRFTKVDRYLNQICDLTGLCYTLNSIDTKLRSV